MNYLESARQMLEQMTAEVETSRETLSADLRELFEERAAIMEYDAGLPRERAESRALRDILFRMKSE